MKLTPSTFLVKTTVSMKIAVFGHQSKISCTTNIRRRIRLRVPGGVELVRMVLKQRNTSEIWIVFSLSKKVFTFTCNVMY